MISSDNLFFFLWTCLPLFSILWVSFLLQSVETKITMYGFLIYVFFCIVERLSTVSIQQIHLFAMVFLSLCKKPGHFLSPAWSTDYLWWPATLALSAPHTSQLHFYFVLISCWNFCQLQSTMPSPLNYGLRGSLDKKSAKVDPCFSVNKLTRWYLVHFLSWLWPIFSTEKNWMTLVQKICLKL